MMAGTRSRKGCWTCRLRRKKCDERNPSCATCETLGIECHSYGPRPDWMDGREREKQAALEVRRNIKKVSLKRPQSASNSSPKSSATVTIGESSHRPETKFDHGEICKPQQFSASLSLGSLHQGSASWMSAATSEFEILEFPAFQSRPPDAPSDKADVSAFTKLAPLDYSLPRSCEKREAFLLMYYLDCVFPVQFKMYSPSVAEGGRGWVLPMLFSCPPLYHVTLALSAHCLEASGISESSDESRRLSFAELDLALQKLQHYIHAFMNQDSRGSLEDNLKVCSCILQMIAFMVFAGGTDDWQIHLQGASTTASILIDAYISQNRLSKAETPPAAPSVLETLTTRLDLAVLQFFISIFIWFDICACVSTGSKTILGEKWLQVLEGKEVTNLRLDRLMGVENWVMILIAKIASLDMWKRESQKNGRLSLVELVSRATDIENGLKSGLSKFSNGYHSQKKNDKSGRIPLSNLSIHSRYITTVYASSALTYLHVVVSGAYPELLEIRHSMLNTIKEMKKIPDPILVRHLTWPLLITGSMALTEEEQFFRDIFIMGGITRTSVGNSWNLLRILEQCWKMRGSPELEVSKDGYWAAVMASMNIKVLCL